VVILLVACASPDPPAIPDAPVVPAVALKSPAEADDLDPADGVVHVALTAARHSFEIAGETIDGYAYDGQVPGPTIRARVGDTLVVDFTNGLDAETTIHWHGVHAPAAMDGVTWLAAPIPPGFSFTYTLPLTTAGTFWYHPHVDVDRQVDLGLYGFLVVEDPAEPAMDELLVALDAWGEDATDDHGLPDPARLTWTANGLVLPTATLDGPVRARLLNASNASYLSLSGLGDRVAGDQGRLDTSDTSGDVLLAPGDRAEVLFDNDAAVLNAPWTLAGGAALGDTSPVFHVSAAGDAPAFPWSPAGVSPDPGRTDLTYVFHGGADGEDWLINGEAWPDVTIGEVALGDEVIVELRNLSATEHPFHLHGHAFEVLSVDGVPPAARQVEDTVNVGIRQIVRLRFVADNPGDWMVHCHLLGHEEGGMMTVLRVE
jgi:FtsP/CotA-like multicopper oxidase with cupredoxin domain